MADAVTCRMYASATSALEKISRAVLGGDLVDLPLFGDQWYTDAGNEETLTLLSTVEDYLDDFKPMSGGAASITYARGLKTLLKACVGFYLRRLIAASEALGARGHRRSLTSRIATAAVEEVKHRRSGTSFAGGRLDLGAVAGQGQGQGQGPGDGAGRGHARRRSTVEGLRASLAKPQKRDMYYWPDLTKATRIFESDVRLLESFFVGRFRELCGDRAEKEVAKDVDALRYVLGFVSGQKLEENAAKLDSHLNPIMSPVIDTLTVRVAEAALMLGRGKDDVDEVVDKLRAMTGGGGDGRDVGLLRRSVVPEEIAFHE